MMGRYAQGGPVTTGRSANLEKTLGRKFQNVVDELNHIGDFATDNNLFLLRERELTERLEQNDSPYSRRKIADLVDRCVYHLAREEYAALAKTLTTLNELANAGVDRDKTWDAVLALCERRAKLAVAALTAMAKEQNVITTRDVFIFMGRIMDIALQVLSVDDARKFIGRVREEVVRFFGGVGPGDTEPPILTDGRSKDTEEKMG